MANYPRERNIIRDCGKKIDKISSEVLENRVCALLDYFTTSSSKINVRKGTRIHMRILIHLEYGSLPDVQSPY